MQNNALVFFIIICGVSSKKTITRFPCKGEKNFARKVKTISASGGAIARAALFFALFNPCISGTTLTPGAPARAP